MQSGQVKFVAERTQRQCIDGLLEKNENDQALYGNLFPLGKALLAEGKGEREEPLRRISGAKVKCTKKTRLFLTFNEILDDEDVNFKRLGCLNIIGYELEPGEYEADFSCSDPRLNRIFEAGRETFRQNAVDVFMDCPSRERGGYLCDSFFTARVAPDLSGDTIIEKNRLMVLMLSHVLYAADS